MKIIIKCSTTVYVFKCKSVRPILQLLYRGFLHISIEELHSTPAHVLDMTIKQTKRCSIINVRDVLVLKFYKVSVKNDIFLFSFIYIYTLSISTLSQKVEVG